jgi:hypothetical protein
MTIRTAIPDAAVEAACEEFSGSYYLIRGEMRAMLAAALPHLNADGYERGVRACAAKAADLYEYGEQRGPTIEATLLALLEDGS